MKNTKAFTLIELLYPAPISRIETLRDDEARGGFTLIELLVVVLIIGILAAVAMPQYKLAVVKARVGTILPIIKSMAEAEENIYLANGSYSRGPEQLDIDMPQACRAHTDSGNWTCGDFVIDWCGGGHCVRALHCPEGTANVGLCENQSDFIIWKYYDHTTAFYAGKWQCSSSTDLGRKICNSLKLN